MMMYYRQTRLITWQISPKISLFLIVKNAHFGWLIPPKNIQFFNTMIPPWMLTDPHFGCIKSAFSSFWMYKITNHFPHFGRIKSAFLINQSH